jgi:hypothetical protein
MRISISDRKIDSRSLTICCIGLRIRYSRRGKMPILSLYTG